MLWADATCHVSGANRRANPVSLLELSCLLSFPSAHISLKLTRKLSSEVCLLIMKDFGTINDARMRPLRVDLFCQQDGTFNKGSPRTENKATEWTDEKHMLYLKSLEASFIRRYHNILRPPSRSHRNSSSDQFKTAYSVGCWKMIDFDKRRSLLKRTEHSDTLISNPWIQRLKPVRRGKLMSSSSCDTMDTDQEIDLREMSDQNFVGEIVEGRSESDNRKSKRLRIDLGSATTSSGEQVRNLELS